MESGVSPGRLEDDFDGLTVQCAGPESPALHCFFGRVAQTHRQALDDFHLLDASLLVDDCLDDDDAGDAGLARRFVVLRFDPARDDWSLDVAADAQRSIGRRILAVAFAFGAGSRPADFTAENPALLTTDDATDLTADFAANGSTFLAADDATNDAALNAACDCS